MLKERLVHELQTVQEFFDRSTNCLTEEDSEFAPKEGMYTVAQQVAHAAQTIDWFLDGMFNPNGFDLNFEAHIQKALDCKSLKDARQAFGKAVARGVEMVGSSDDNALREPLAEGPIMSGPRLIVVESIAEHTAHHRGALAVYSRLLGKEPKMPYMDM